LCALHLFPPHEVHLGEEIERAKLHSQRGLAYSYYDYLIKQLANKGNRERIEFSFAPRELLAKKIGCANPNTTEFGMIIPVLNEYLDQIFHYYLSDQLHYQGLHAYLFIPLDKTANLPAQLIFRGTKGAISAHRNLDPTGVGKRVFDECAPKIQAMLENYALAEENPTIEIIGHSLGGTDAERTIILLTELSNAHLFTDIKLFAYCSPKLDHPTLLKWEKNLIDLEQAEKKPSIQLNFAYHEDDLIARTWIDHLSWPDSCYLIVSSPSGVTDTPKHHTVPFFKEGNFDHETENRNFVVYNSHPEERLLSHLQQLQELEETNLWYLYFKSYFVDVESPEDVQDRIDRIISEQEKFEQITRDSAEQPWWKWLSYFISPAQSTYGWLTGAEEEEDADNSE